MTKGRQLNLFGYDKKGGLTKRRQLITLPLDTLVLLSVVIVLLLVIAFSLGVERGRKIAKVVEEEKISEPAMLALATETSRAPKKQKGKDKEEFMEISLAPKKGTKVAQPMRRLIKTRPGEEKRYLIQVASYLTKKAAEQEAAKLKEKGHPVKIQQKGRYVVLFVGEFDNRREAEDNLKILKKTYHDCFIRRL
ncbi:MAG: SPOR domain-containing protein [Candidatus Omnitrophota bacterium]|nr:MAG: SPOR domain-containing protein [Candidatus Omnitrophota bacterium]